MCSVFLTPAAMNNVKLLVFLLVALCGSSDSCSGKSSPYLFEYKDKLYYFETFYKATFFKAFMACNNMGMNLLSIESNEEFDKIHAFVKDKPEYKQDMIIWSSGARKEKGQFYWMSTGTPVALSRWHANQPNNFQERENCVQMWLYNTQFLLNDIPCEREMYFMCDLKKY